jgi:hypothetical protein
MVDQRPDRILERIDALEREIVRWRRLALCSASLLVIALVTAAAKVAKPPETVTARRAFVLADDRGTTRASLGITDDGSTSLAIFGKNGEAKPRILVGLDASESFASISINDRQFQKSVMVGNHTSKEAGSELGLFVLKESKPILKASAFENGYPNIQIYDQQYRPRLLLALEEENQRILVNLKGVNGKGRIMLEVGESNAPSIKSYPQAGPNAAK